MSIRIRNLFIISLFLFSGQLFSQTPYFTSTEYKKALWMTTRFYGGQRSGDNNWLLYNHQPSGVSAALKGKSFMGDGDAGYDLSGGWHDCGDHVKFGQTEFYSAYMLLKGYEAFPTGYGDYYAYDYQGYKTANSWNFEGTGHAPNGIPDVLDEVKHATDYFIKCTRNSTTFYYQVGQGGPDHMLWETSVQMQTQSVSNGGEPRVAYKNPSDASMPSFCGAALALMSRLYRPYDATYADLCLVHAKYAYDYAKAHPGVAGTGDGGFYGANDNWKDDYSSLCAELFWATNTAAYKTEALSFTIASAPGQGSDIWGKNYGFDYTNNGDIAIYNQFLLGNAAAKTVLNTIVNSFYLGNVQSDGQFNGGNTGWGPTRYNANTAFIVALWQKAYGTDGTPHKYIYDNIDYLLGKNSSNQSFIVGFGTKSPKYPHHRNVYLTDNNPSDAVKQTMTIPTKNQQFGLMVGGTRNPSSYSDNVVNYQHTEGGIDYNACLVGVLAYLNSVLAPVSQHPVPNLGADISLCGVGSVVLKSNIATDGKKTFAWQKNGTIVQAASTTANTYTANTAGTYTCVLDSLGKWSTSDDIVVSATLPAVNLGSSVVLCNPATATLDIGATGTGYTYQWKKNSVVITGATSKTYTVSSAGTYVGTLSASGCTSTSGSITVTSSLPTAGHDTLCAAGTAALTITGSGGPYQWYTASTAGTLLTTANSYNPSISASTTYYVQDGSSVSVTAGPSSASNPLTGGTNGGNVGIRFTAAKAFSITQLKVLPYVYSCGSSDNVTATFDLFQGATKIGTYTSTAVPCTGTQSGSPFNTYYTLNFATAIAVPAAGAYTLTPNGGNAIVWFGAGANFSTMDAAGVMDITDDTRDDMSNSFPGIFDIKIQAGSACARTPVYAIIDPAYANCSAAKTAQTITFGAIAAKKYGDPNFTLTATASSGLAVTYTSSNPAVATVTSAGVVTIVGVGSTTITANQAGNATYDVAPAVTQTLVVGKADQTITFGAIAAKVVGDANFTLTATASSALAVTYTSSNPAVATVTSAGVVTIVGVGSTTITASQAGNTNYNAATAVPQTLVVGKANQTITFGAITAKVYGDANFSLTATASSALAVTYTSSNPAVATVTSAGVVTIVGVGSTTITANQAGNANYNAATAVTQTLVVGKANQTITFGAIAAKVVGDPDFTLTATASSGLAVTYTSSNPAVATVTSAGVVTIVGNGSTTITANQAGNANYNAATAVTQTLVVGKANQTITFGAITAKVYGDANFTLTATASSGLAVTYTSSNPAVATVTSAGVVTIVGVGSTTITASQAGNATYNAATAVTQTLVVGKANQTITFGAIAAKVYGDANFTLTATASSGLAVTYTSSNPAVATVTSAGVVTIIGVGSTSITASQAGNTNYNAATAVTQTLVVTKANQTITFGVIASKQVGDPNFTLTATASSGLAVTYTSSDPTVATVTSAGVVTIVGPGSTVITASQAGNANYNAATSVTQTFVVTSPTKTNQTITFGAIAAKVVGDANFTLTATASSGLAVTYTSSNPAVATVTSAGVVTIVGAGSTVITANQAGNATYNAATAVAQTLTVTKKTQTVTFNPITGTKTYGDPTFTLTSSSTSGLPITYTTSDPSVATVSSTGVVTIVGAGTVTITATQAGDGTYASTSVPQTITIGKANQTIAFGALASKVVGDPNFSLTATASSGLAVTYTSSNPAVATVTSVGVVTIIGAGSTVITASQAGNTNYNAATAVTQTLVVTTPAKTNQTITFGALASKVVGDPNFSLTATASSGLAVTYTSSNPAVATVTSAGVVTIV
ncbi:glycoside hydrolase family 9 protein, partial [Cytophaga aurantiaca]|uniref:glycoside hydrolase family 9 protein n=1 Tax=Cytophaga aurantiaca TaxID=29530 RepID=UPI0012FAE1F9